MNKADIARIRELCSLIEREQDPQKFIVLVEELNSLLSSKNSPQKQGEEEDV
jgi:hypothetical protein